MVNGSTRQEVKIAIKLSNDPMCSAAQYSPRENEDGGEEEPLQG